MARFKVKMNVQRIRLPCGINVYMISYSSEGAAQQALSQTLDAGCVTTDFNNLSELNRVHKLNDQVAIMKVLVANLSDKVVELENVNSKLETRMLLYEGLGGRNLSNLSTNQLRAVTDTVDELMSRVTERIRVLNLQQQAQNDEGVAETGLSSTQAVLGSEGPMEGQGGNLSSSDSTEGSDGKEDDNNAE